MGVVALDQAILALDEPINGIDLETTQKLISHRSTLKWRRRYLAALKKRMLNW